MTPRKEESVQRELTAADLATFCTGVKKMSKTKTKLMFSKQVDTQDQKYVHLVPNEFNPRILLPTLPKHLCNKR